MKRLFILGSMSLTLAACNDNIARGDKLTDAERLFLRQRAAAKCVAASNDRYREIENAMNSNMLNFERDQTFKYEFKKDSTVIETSYLYVWKVSPPNVYFRLSITEAGITSNKFIRLDTSSNEDMMRAIQTLECARVALTTVSGSSSKTVNIDTARIRVDTETLTETETDYRFITTYPPFFGNLNKLMTKRTYNNDEAVTKTEKYDYVISANAATVQPLSYTDATIINKSYCLAKFVPLVNPAIYDTYAFPFELDCATSDVDPLKPDANSDGTKDFNPVTELAGPF